MGLGDPNQGALFGGGKLPSKADILMAAIKEKGGDLNGNVQTNLFENRQEERKPDAPNDTVGRKKADASEPASKQGSEDTQTKTEAVEHSNLSPFDMKAKFKRDFSGAETAPIFYSQLQRVIEQKTPNKAVSAQVLAIIKGGQVKQEKVKWLGIEDWLKEQAGRVSKQDVLDFLKANDVQFEEVITGKTWYIYDVSGDKQVFNTQKEAQEGLDWQNEWVDSEGAEVDADFEDGIITVYGNSRDYEALVIKKDTNSERWGTVE